MCMTMVNQINSRVVNPNEINVFKNIYRVHEHKWFWLVFVFEIFILQGMIFLGSNKKWCKVVGTYDMPANLQIISWCIALVGLAVNIGAK